MEKLFVPYDETFILKSLGYNEGYLCGFSFSDGKVLSQAILMSQAFRWFRNKFELIHEIIFYKSKLGVEYEYVIFSLVLPKDDELGNEDEMIRDCSWEGDYPIRLDTKWQTYSSYEEAEVKCLEELIKIANLKLCNSTMP